MSEENEGGKSEQAPSAPEGEPAAPSSPILPASHTVADRIAVLSKLQYPSPVPLSASDLSIEPSAAESVFKGNGSYVLSSGPIDVYVDAPTHVAYVDILGTNNLGDGITLQYADERGGLVFANVVKKNNKFHRAHVGGFTKRLIISRNDGYFRKSKAQVSEIRIAGYPGPAASDWIANCTAFIEEVDFCRDTISEELSKAQKERLQIDADRAALTSERNEHESKVQELRAQIRSIEDEKNGKLAEKTKVEQEVNATQETLLRLEKQAKETQATLNDLSLKHANVSKELEDRAASSSRLISEIAEKKSVLEKLNRDESLFAVDLKGYGLQGWKQSRWHIGIIICAIIAIAAVTYVAFSELNTIWEAIVADPQKITWSLIAITRFGMIMIFTAAIGGLTTIGYAFVKRLMHIQERALDLSAMSILARDVTDATISDPSVTPDQRMAVFHASRMALVRNLLSGFFEKLAELKKDERESEIFKLREGDIQTAVRTLLEKGYESLKKTS